MTETTAIRRPRRWDTPFAETALNDRDIDRILDMPVFKKIDASRFTGTMSLRDIIKNDARIESFNAGDIVIRENDYSNSVLVLKPVRISLSICHNIGRSRVLLWNKE